VAATVTNKEEKKITPRKQAGRKLIYIACRNSGKQGGRQEQYLCIYQVQVGALIMLHDWRQKKHINAN